MRFKGIKLLIAPEGIEIIVDKSSLGKQQILLIAPEGIEIRNTDTYRSRHGRS